MKVQGSECSIVIKTEHREFDVPYSEETIREAYSLLQEEASIEGDGICKVIRKKCGVTGCVVTPLTIGTVEHLFYLAFGSAGHLNFVSGTRNLYQYRINLLPVENNDFFDLIQDRNGDNGQGTGEKERRLYEGCRVCGFELRIVRDEAIKLKLNIYGDCPAVIYPYTELVRSQTSEMSSNVLGEERFFGENVSYKINGKEYKNIYGLTVLVKKDNGTKTEIWIKRSLEKVGDIPDVIEELNVEAKLLKDKYEFRFFGAFKLTFKKLVLVSDETSVNTVDAVIGPVRYYVSGNVCADVYTTSEEL